MKRALPFVIFLFLTVCAHAEEKYGRGHLTVQEIERVKVFKGLLDDVDKKSLRQTIEALEKTGNPPLYLQMREAMAKTYADIVREQNVEGQKKKEWLYSMVTLNMAYLQFAGTQDAAGHATSLNRLIRRKLKAYLPPDVFHQPGFHYSLE